jgi:hypothetical protein
MYDSNMHGERIKIFVLTYISIILVKAACWTTGSVREHGGAFG